MTPAGRALADHARLVLGQMERLRGELRAYAQDGLRGYVRLLSNTAALEEHLPDLLTDWLASNPGVDLELEERPSPEVARAVAQGRAEAGVLAETGDAPELELLPFRTDRLVLIAPVSHPLAEKEAIAFAEALDEDFVGLPLGSALDTLIARQAARLGRPIRLRVRLRGFDALRRMVQGGVGVAVIPEAAAQGPSCVGVRVLRITDPWAVRRLFVCVRRLDALPRHARALVDHLVGAAADRGAALA